MRMGNEQINTNPCTQAEQNTNWATTKKLLTLVIDVISAGTSGDTFKVAVDAPNIATPNYLNDQMFYPASGGTLDVTPSVGVPVVADVTSAKERLQADFTQVSGYSTSAAGRVLTLNDTAEDVSWVDAVTVTDSFTVKNTSLDTTPKYLHPAFHLNATYASSADLLVATASVDIGAGSLKERPFVDVSIISGYHATEFRVLTIEGNISAYATITVIGQKLVADATFLAFMDARYVTVAGGGSGGGTAKFGKADANILPRAGTVAKSGTVSIWTMDGSGNLSDTGNNETWWNISSTGLVRAGDFIQAKLDATSGKMLIDFEDCTMSDL